MAEEEVSGSSTNGGGGARSATSGRRVLVEGRGGLLDGVRIALAPNVPFAVGRSRSCDVSFRRAPAFVKREDKERLLRSHAFNRISRIHLEMTLLADGRVEVRDLSHNGT